MKSFAPAIIWLLMITVMSLIPGKSIPGLDWTNIFSLDKAAHAFIYAVLMLTFRYGMWKVGHGKSFWIQSLIVFALYGVLIEVLQYSMSVGRYFENLDIIANIIGLFIGYWIAHRAFK